jgi:hypothetical protein
MLQSLIDSSVIPSNIDESSVQIFNTIYDTTGTHVSVDIISQTSAEMHAMTASINLANIAQVYPPYETEVVQAPMSVTDTLGSAFGAVKTIMSGLLVDSVVFEESSLHWIVSAYYEPAVSFVFCVIVY